MLSWSYTAQRKYPVRPCILYSTGTSIHSSHQLWYRHPTHIHTLCIPTLTLTLLTLTITPKWQKNTSIWWSVEHIHNISIYLTLLWHHLCGSLCCFAVSCPYSLPGSIIAQACSSPTQFVMDTLWNRADHYIFVLRFLSIYLLLFFLA